MIIHPFLSSSMDAAVKLLQGICGGIVLILMQYCRSSLGLIPICIYGLFRGWCPYRLSNPHPPIIDEY